MGGAGLGGGNLFLSSSSSLHPRKQEEKRIGSGQREEGKSKGTEGGGDKDGGSVRQKKVEKEGISEEVMWEDDEVGRWKTLGWM